MMKGSEIRRIELLDLWRTVAIVCMIIYHLLNDLAMFGVIAWQQFYTPGLNAFQKFICCSFIILSGISSRFSKSNVRRGVLTLCAAVIVSAASFAVGAPIRFGVLHFLGCAMIIYGVLGKYIEKLPKYLAPALFIALFALTPLWTDAVTVNVKFLFPLGFMYPGFYSSDYFPLMPWLFLFLFGTWLGGLIRENDGSKWRQARVPGALTWPGRHSLLIYMLHQPVMYGALWLLYR